MSIYNRGDISSDKERISIRLNDDCDNKVNDMVVSNNAVIGALDKFQVSRAVGSDGISAELLKLYIVLKQSFIGDAYSICSFTLGILLATCWKLNCVQYLKIRMGT